MAGTGILIAAHGAALVNSMFLPQHAAVIEIFPFLMKKVIPFHAI
jgi:capsular polysaccharide biosynthesis protein